MDRRIRKTLVIEENHYVETGIHLETPIRTVIAIAVLTNPWINDGFVEDLDPLIAEVAPQVAEALVLPLMARMENHENIEAFGKAAVVGLRGELEHASALIHTLRFGNKFRTAAQAESFLSFTNKRAPAGTLVTVPMVHKNDRSKRSHFLTTETVVPDAPMEDEILVAIAACSSGRPFPRIGDRHQDRDTGRV